MFHQKNYLAKWLRDAYAMEKAAIEILNKQVKYLNDYPSGRNRIEQHLEESQWQCEEVGRCLEILGCKPSGIKDTVGRMTAIVSTITNVNADDETLKNFISDAAFEHMEIAAYRALILAADEYGYPQIKLSCQKILRQEIAMAQWCENHIEPATIEFLSRHELVV